MRTRTTINFILFSFAATALMTSCHGGSDFKTDEASGVQYRFINHADTGAKPGMGDYVHVAMLWTGKNAKGDADSVYLDSHLKGKGDSVGALMFPLRKSYNGCLEQGIAMMCKGDSAVFKINADSLFQKMFRVPADKMPPAAKNIKLIGFKTEKDMMGERQAMMQKRMQEAQVLKAKEPADITACLQKNNFKGKPDADSIFYLKVVKGKGKQVKDGDSVFVGYTLMSTDGTVLEKSDRGTGVRTLNMVYSKNMALIKGWISVIGKMHEGDKVTVLIPSAMAYGAMGKGQIQPYTPLVFDMEMVKVKSNK